MACGLPVVTTAAGGIEEARRTVTPGWSPRPTTSPSPGTCSRSWSTSAPAGVWARPPAAPRSSASTPAPASAELASLLAAPSAQGCPVTAGRPEGSTRASSSPCARPRPGPVLTGVPRPRPRAPADVLDAKIDVDHGATVLYRLGERLVVATSDPGPAGAAVSPWLLGSRLPGLPRRPGPARAGHGHGPGRAGRPGREGTWGRGRGHQGQGHPDALPARPAAAPCASTPGCARRPARPSGPGSASSTTTRARRPTPGTRCA